MSEYIAELAENYFSTLNPIAARLHSDITETKNAYEKLWDQLSPQEQSQIIDESIIKPEVTLKYALSNKLKSGKGQPQIYGQKIIHDDQCVYRDEFSAPFSYKTQSQIDLRVFSEAHVLPGSPLLKSNATAIKTALKEKEIFAEKIVNITTDMNEKYDLSELHYSSKSSTLNETPSDTSQDEKTCLLPSSDGIIKTGYDFLDNW